MKCLKKNKVDSFKPKDDKPRWNTGGPIDAEALFDKPLAAPSKAIRHDEFREAAVVYDLAWERFKVNSASTHICSRKLLTFFPIEHTDPAIGNGSELQGRPVACV